MRIFVLTSDDPYAHFCMSRLVHRHYKNILGIFVGPLLVKSGGPLKTLFRVWKKSGWRYALSETAEGVFCKLFMAVKRLFGCNRIENFHDTAALWGVPVERIVDANGEEFRRRLEEAEPDLLILARYNQILNRRLLAIPRVGAINVHSGILPRYRGLSPTINAMIRGEKYAGVTVHKVIKKIDSGGIIGSARIEINYQESALRNCVKAMLVGQPLLNRIVSGILDFGDIIAERQPETDDYFSWPEREDIRRFKRSGGKLFRFSDIFFLWKIL